MTQDGGTEYHPGEQFTDDCRLPPALHQIREYPACQQQRADLDEKMENLKLAESLQPSTARGLTRRARRLTKRIMTRGTRSMFSLTTQENRLLRSKHYLRSSPIQWNRAVKIQNSLV